MAAAHSVFCGTAEPRLRKFCIGLSGMMLFGCRPVPPKCFWATPCRYSSTPTEPITLPSGAALRSGRNTRKWAIAPISAPIASATTNATHTPTRAASPTA